MKNRDLGPLGPSNLDPIYVIYVFWSMLSCILCERQKFSESHKLKRFGARYQFRAARFVTVLINARSINTMKWVVENCVYVVKGPQIVKKWHQIDDSSLLQECQFCMLAMYKGQYHAEND